MRLSALLLLLSLANLAGPVSARDALFRRGDSNQDGKVDLSDATRTLGFLFLGTESVSCRDAADANDDGGVDIADPIHTLGFLFVGTAPPPAPFEECGADPSLDGLDCDTFAACEQPPPAGEGLFGKPASYPPGPSSPTAVALEDLDGDGTLDVLVAKSGGRVSVGLGKGDGSFGEAIDHEVGFHSFSVAAGDLDGNGALDLVVGNQLDLAVLPGAGDGTFGEPASFDVGGDSAFSVALEDLDGDGALDLAAAFLGSNEISVLPGVGDGTFRDPVGHPIPGAGSLALGDLDGDGLLDLAVAGAAGVSVLLGVGDATFGEPTVFGNGPGSERLVSAIALGDLDGDGALDIAVAYGFTCSGAVCSRFRDVSVLLGAGDGTFADPVSYGVGTVPRSVALGDLDRDGVLDIAVANEFTDDVSVLIGVGDGTFCDAVDYAVGEDPWSLALGDLDRDGDLDLVTANIAGGDVSILLGR